LNLEKWVKSQDLSKDELRSLLSKFKKQNEDIIKEDRR